MTVRETNVRNQYEGGAEMPWLNLVEFLRHLLREDVDPEDIEVYVPEPCSED